MTIKPLTHNVGGTFKLNTKGASQYVGEDAFEHLLKTHKISSDNVYCGNGPLKEIDFEYSSSEELLEQISQRYNMEKLKPWEIGQVLDMLKQGGVISSDEYWLAQGVIPITGSVPDFPRPEPFENVLEDYYTNFETYVNNNVHLYPPKQAQRLHESLLIHKKWNVYLSRYSPIDKKIFFY